MWTSTPSKAETGEHEERGAVPRLNQRQLQRCREIEADLGPSYYTRIDAPASAEQKARLELPSPDTVPEQTLAGDAITAKLTRARGNQAPIQGLKIATSNGWFAARPSGTENIIKIYAESFKSAAHLGALAREAQALVNRAIGSGA